MKHDIRITKKCFENVTKFRVLRNAERNEDYTQYEIWNNLISGIACCNSALPFSDLRTGS
jgi:hypothetical protein